MNRVRVPAALTAVVFLLVSSMSVAGQTPPASGGDDLDSLFTDNGTSTSNPSTSNPPTESPPAASSGTSQSTTPAVRPDDITQDQKIHYFGNLDVYGLIGYGWSGIPDPGSLTSGLGTEASGYFSASLGFEVRPAPQLRIKGTLSYNWPSTGPQLSELFADYSVHEAVFFRLGIYDYTWGNSQFFQFSNLPSRGLPGWGISNEPLWQKTNIISIPPVVPLPVSFRMTVPFGLDSLTFLARFDMQDYGFPDLTTPNPKDAGYGVQFTLVTGPIEWTLGGFWQTLLAPRSSLSLKTSVLGFDVSAETTMAFPVRLVIDSPPEPIATTGGGIYVGGMMQRIYPTAVLGIAREWQDPRIKISAEYAYNGERDPGISWLADETGPGGHNTVLALRFSNMASSAVTLNAIWQHNWSDGSGLISPLFELSPAALTTIQFGPVFVYGPSTSEVLSNRLVPGNKRLELLLLVKVSDSYRQ